MTPFAKLTGLAIMGAVSALIFVGGLSAQTRRLENKVAPLSRQEANQRWTEFSIESRMADYCMSFTLEHIPRKGAETKRKGFIFGKQLGNTAFTRIVFDADSGGKEFLLENSPDNQRVWKFENGKLEEIKKSDWTKPFFNGCIYAPFDLLVPYRNWPVSYAGPDRIGQAVHYFDARSESFPDFKVRVALTREFNSPAQTQILGPNDEPIKTLSLGSIKKIDNVWLMLELSMRDESSRDKDKLIFTRGNLTIKNPAEIFRPESLGKMLDIPKLKNFR